MTSATDSAAPAIDSLIDEPLTPLPPAEREIQLRIREIALAELVPRAAHLDATSSFPEESFRALAQAGLAGLLMPPELGGSGHSLLAYCAAMEEISAACGATSTVYMTQMHCAHPIALGSNEDAKHRLIPGLCDGSLLGALAVTEPAAGSDVASMRTTARRDGDAFIINGVKTFITTGDRADVIVLFATVDPQVGRHGITAFLLERGVRGLSTGRVIPKLGLRGSSTAELFLENCRVPTTALITEPGQGYGLSMQTVVKSRMSAAAQGVGFARAAYVRATTWAGECGLLASSGREAQATQFRLAEMRTQVATARNLLYATARLVDCAEREAVTEVSMCKLYCTDTGFAVASSAVDLLGQDGDSVDWGVERILRDARATQIYDGTNQVQRLLIARDVRRREASA